jgi:polysaccharide export outer membrane protein
MTRLLPVAIAAVLSMAGCATSSSLPPAPAKPATPVPGAGYTYSIGPGDTLAVNVWRHPELTVTAQVRPDGKITLPLVEDLPAIGRSPTDLGKDIEERLSKFVREPSVTVQVTNFVGNSGENVRVVGQAMKPAAIPYKQGMTLLDVMIQVGGITEYASGNRAVLIRSAEGNKQYAVRLKDLLKGGDVSANVELQPGDVIMIPESWF